MPLWLEHATGTSYVMFEAREAVAEQTKAVELPPRVEYRDRSAVLQIIYDDGALRFQRGRIVPPSTSRAEPMRQLTVVEQTERGAELQPTYIGREVLGLPESVAYANDISFEPLNPEDTEVLPRHWLTRGENFDAFREVITELHLAKEQRRKEAVALPQTEKRLRESGLL